MINEQYESIIEPKNLITHIEDFDAWLDLAETKEDLESCLGAFVEDELYEHCTKIQNKIKEYGGDKGIKK